MVFHDCEYHQDFRKIHKILKMVKYARCSSREKLAFASVGTKPAGGELVLDLVSIEIFCVRLLSTFRDFLFLVRENHAKIDEKPRFFAIFRIF